MRYKMHSTRTQELSLPSNFHLSPSHYHYSTLSHSPALSSHPTSPTLHSSLDTPLASYAIQRRYRTVVQSEDRDHTHNPQVSLSTLSPTGACLGAVGGHFNSTTRIKFVPLPTLYTPQQVNYRGIRSVCLHTDRYLPAERHGRSTISDSFLNLPLLDNRPKTRLVGQGERLRKARVFKRSSGVLPHRMEQLFYMSGHSARVQDKLGFSSNELEEMKRVKFAENPTLFYGRGLVQPPATSRAHQSRSVQRFEVRLKTALEHSRNYGLGDDDGLDSGCETTPAPTIEEEEEHREEKHHRRRTFVTETRTGCDT